MENSHKPNPAFRKQTGHLHQRKTVVRFIGALLLAIMVPMGLSMHEANAVINRDRFSIRPPGTTLEILNHINEVLRRNEEALNIYKEELKKEECQGINLDFCASLLYAIDNSEGIKNGIYDNRHKCILSNYIDREQVYEFGRTGKGLDVIYFRDDRGKKTEEPAICYVANPENKIYKISDIEEVIGWWEKDAPGYLRSLVANDVRILFQSQASSNRNFQLFNYERMLIYFNFSKNDLDSFQSGLINGFSIEMFGTRGSGLIDSVDETVEGGSVLEYRTES